MKKGGTLKHYFKNRCNYIEEWLFPVKCPVCSGILLPREALVHKECEERFSAIREPLCKRCGRPLSEETAEYCERCRKDKENRKDSELWDSGRCAFSYQGEVASAVLKIKQYGTKETIAFFARRMVEFHMGYLLHLHPDCIVPVPLHPFKKRQRGFNQAELLAEAVSEEFMAYHLPVQPLLKKTVRTAEQKTLSGAERKRNLAHAFQFEEVCTKQLPSAVLLVDDVFTTGSTLAACAAVLKKQGVRQVGFLCACLSEGEL